MERKIRQYLEGRLSGIEQRELLHWIRQGHNRTIFDAVKKEWWNRKSSGTDKKIQDFGQVRLAGRLKEKQQVERSSNYLKAYKYAAIALLMISLSGGLFFSHIYQKKQELKFTEIRTDPGQISGMTLPDGSKIWLNSGTKLSYNNWYGISNRDIKINGEAFFSVAKNKKIPFTVNMGALKIEVTGTQFEVSNYDDSNSMKVVLEKGSVDIHSKNDQLIMQLSPKEMATFNKTAMTIEKVKVNPEHYTSWRNGIIQIFELPLEQVVVKLGKRYNQKFEVDPAVKDLPFTFSIENESLSDILYLLEKISPVKAMQEGDIIKLKYEPKHVAN
jgi:ferric-dicitrate binding protein FerR (iron transport regulator)